MKKIKILWITNLLLPEAAELIGEKASNYGGWVSSLAKLLSEEVDLVIVSPHSGNHLKISKGEKIKYYYLPNKNIKQSFKEIITKENPALIHVHGTEYNYGMQCYEQFPDLDYIVSIQGLVSVIIRYYDGGINKLDNRIIPKIQLFITKFYLNYSRKNFLKRSKSEIEYLKNFKNIMGRTDWDKSHCETIGKKINYYHSNELLREEFYNSKKWDINNIEKYSIFLSQISKPIKGFLPFLMAVNIVKKKYPQLKIYIAGENIFEKNTLRKKIKYLLYGRMFQILINKYKLNDNIKLLGSISSENIKNQLLKTHVFVCPSSIENSPNSLAEAQILGVPSIGSYVGGIPSMIDDKKTGIIYRFEEYEMLASNIIEIFENEKLCKILSENSINIAENRHNIKNNIDKIISIYKNVYKNRG